MLISRICENLCSKKCNKILALTLMLFVLSGCASQKATLDAPELPAKHWLDESPGVPVEYKAKLEAAVPNLYSADKVFAFEDCVYLAIQQSPLLVNSAVELEIQKLQLTDAVWDYLPEPRVSLLVSNNITSYNMGGSNLPSGYGQTNLEVQFFAAFPNPIKTYFNHQSQKALVNLAISTHRKAIAEAIFDIATIYQRLEAKRKILEIQKELLPLNKKLTAYWQQLEAVDGSQGVALNLAIQNEREGELQVERTEIETLMLRTDLKVMTGVEIQHKLNIDTSNADSIFQDFDGDKLHWEDRWTTQDDEYLIRAQVALKDFGIMVAWAEYIPDMTLQVNNNPPSGQYHPPDGIEDTFIHLNFDFPLIDWGRRYRGVQTARMEKALAFQEQIQARTEYSNAWIEAQQEYALAKTSLKIAQTNLDVAQMKAKEAEINFNEGTGLYPKVAETQEELLKARADFVQSELDYDLARLSWMNVAGVLSERYIGKPAKEIF